MVEAKSNKDLDRAYEFFEQGNFKKALSVANDYLKADDLGIRLTAKIISALAYFNDGNYSAATSIYKKLVVITNTDHDWFNLCKAAVLAGLDEVGDAAIEKAISKSGVLKTSRLSSTMMRYYYAQSLADKGRFLKAKIELKVLLTVHGAVSITDGQYLFMNGYPTLFNTLDVTKKVYDGLNRDPEILKWLVSLKNEVDDEGVKEISEFIDILEMHQ